MDRKNKQNTDLDLFKDIIRAMMNKGENVNGKDNDDWTPLMHATYKGHKDLVGILIESGADVNAKEHFYGFTPLMWAAARGDVGIVKTLLVEGAEIEARDSNYDLTPLMLAASRGHVSVVQALLEKGANVDACDYEGKTALMRATTFGYTKVVNLLKKAGALQ